MSNKYLNLLGLAMRARKCTLGEENIVKDIQRQKAKIVLLANDTGKQTRKKLSDKCQFYNVPFYVVDDRDTISQAIGKSGRVAIAILDDGFANKIKLILDESIRG
ncbi:YlxQ family RNA-binding protein [Aquibacillus sp. 3ASR75-11]|uniref:YlxQ family RNA-binding protein n=1 Tax=Terrihalobacillus insolitus TaxID=2950438 RepID=A0A9X3WPI3_9BACI|nr:YlxQ family RNA-binding protein [Terrihalobacillus insolitus]MDC3414101.1 YlxQ family RNA-binding protein [Terrihalobacillus insolitus]MDC3423542.1 YlxQ family RNA-binding protein [Terrihalobacillus insolitus]